VIVGGIDVKTLCLEKAPQKIDQRMIVVDDEQLVHRTHFAFS
jgi:hypothetical protein